MAKFSPSGTLEWGTYYGDDELHSFNNTQITKIALDSDNNVFICGGTSSLEGISTPGSWQPYLNGDKDGFIAKFASNGERIWGTYYGNTSTTPMINEITYIHIDTDDNIIITGNVGIDGSSMGTAAGTYKPNPDSKYTYLAKFSNSGSRIWHTYLDAYENYITTDEDGNIYLVGTLIDTTGVNDIVTPSAYQVYSAGGRELLISKFTSTGNRVWSTFYGGDGAERGLISEGYFLLYRNNEGIIYSPYQGGSIYIFGNTSSTTGINNGCDNVATTDYRRGFIGRYDLNGYLHYSGYFDEGIQEMDLMIDNNGRQALVLVTSTTIDGLATAGSYKEDKTGLNYSGLITKLIEICPSKDISLSYTEPVITASEDFHIYNWYHNNVLIHSDTTKYFYTASNTLEITDTTGYYYCIATKCGCTYFSDTIFFSSAAGITDVYTQQSLDIHPNPTYNEIIIETQANTTLTGILKISDVYGRVVYSQPIQNQNNTITINISDLTIGNYIVTIQSDMGIFIGKVTKL